MTEADEQALLGEISRGNHSAFWPIWQRHQPRVAEVCRRHMNGVAADADDAVGRALIAAYAKMQKYADSILNVEAWLTRLSCNICLDIHRERCRVARLTVAIDADGDAHEVAFNGVFSPETQCLASEIGNRIGVAIAELPPPLRDAARLRFLEEQSYPDMARRLSITVENARKRVQQSRSLLRERLKPDFGP